MLTSSYPQNAQDSSSGFLRYLGYYLARQGVAIHVLAPSGATSGIEQENGVTVQRFRYFPARWQKLAYGSGILPNLRRAPALWFQVPFFILAMMGALLRLRLKTQPHLIHAHWVIPQGLVAVMAKLLLRTPVIVSIHGADAFALKRGFLSSVKRFCLRHSDAWTSNTRATAEAITHGHKLPLPHILPMGVDIDRFASGSRDRLRSHCRPDDLIVLFVGRLIEKKGVDDLIKAYARLPEKLRDRTTVWIVGRGELEDLLRTLSTELGIGEKIKFLGEIPNDQLPDYYAAVDLFVGPSVEAVSGDTEGQGVVFIEAFAAGLCVIATRVGGIPEVVDDGHTGMLVSPRNPTELASAMQRLLSDPGLRERLGCSAKARARECYAWEIIASRFVDLYRSVLEQ